MVKEDDRGHEEDEDEDDGEGQELAQLQKTVGDLKSELDKTKESTSILQEKLENADKELLSDEYLTYLEKSNKTKSTPHDEGEFNLDEASNVDVVKHLESKYKGDIETAFKEVTGRLNKTEERIGLAFAQIDVALTSMKYSDFNEHAKAIFKVAKDNPNWNAEKCYKQFKLENKQHLEEETKKAEIKLEEEQKALTEKGGMPSHVSTHKTVDKETAAEMAYRKAFGNKDG